MTSWIDLPLESRAGAPLAESYAKVASSRGRVANVLKAHATRPAAMLVHLALFRSLMFTASEFTRAAASCSPRRSRR